MKKTTTLALLAIFILFGSQQVNSQVRSSVKQTVTFSVNRSAKRVLLAANSQISVKKTVSKISDNKSMVTVTE